jgi:hypothetical protein
VVITEAVAVLGAEVVEVPELEAVVVLVPEVVRGTQVMIILFKIRSVYLFTF